MASVFVRLYEVLSKRGRREDCAKIALLEVYPGANSTTLSKPNLQVMSLIKPPKFVVFDVNAFNAHGIRPRMRLRGSPLPGLMFALPCSYVHQLVGTVIQLASVELTRLKLTAR